jgi:hypothetical protein
MDKLEAEKRYVMREKKPGYYMNTVEHESVK